MGDFGDLKQFVVDIVLCGGDFVGLNLIYVLFLVNLEGVSLYSLFFCCWFNILYIDVSLVFEFVFSVEVQ